METYQAKLSEVAEIITGIVDSPNAEGLFQYYCYQPNSFSPSGEVGELPVVMRKEQISVHQLVKIGDLLVKRLNPNFPLLIRNLLGDSVVSTNLYIVRAKQGVLPEYLAFLFEQPSVMMQISELSGANSAIKAISAKKLMNITIPLMPMEKQKLIGSCWGIIKRQKQLLNEYMIETDRLASAISAQILKLK